MAETPSREPDLIERELTGIILDAAIKVHRALGPGLLERAYRQALRIELEARGLRVDEEVVIDAHYAGQALGLSYRADLVVEGRVVLEIKSVETFLPVHEAQLLTYLRMTGMHVGVVVNFNVTRLVHGWHRRVL